MCSIPAEKPSETCEEVQTHGHQHGTCMSVEGDHDADFLLRTEGLEKTCDLLPVSCGGVFEDTQVG